MNAESPENTEKQAESGKEKSLREFQERKDTGSKLVEGDKTDPERGPIVRLVRKTSLAAGKDYAEKISKNPSERSQFFDDFQAFVQSFLGHFGPTEARRYRLYHIIIGSSPLGDANLFDAEGEWSVATKMSELAKKYNIDIEKV